MVESTRKRVARATARTVPWVMGTLAASMREEGHGLHPSQFRVLLALQHAATTPSEIAEHMEVSLPTVSKTLTVLERRGWIERADDKNDRRRVILRATPEGRDAARTILDRGIERLAEVLASASDAELDAIERGVETLDAVLARAHAEHGYRHCRRAGAGGSAAGSAHGVPSVTDTEATR